MKALDLFSGIGGFALGLERAGIETAAFCEISPKCRALLNHHWPEVPSYDDVETLTAERLAADGVDFDLLCGGFPCQDLSYAGRGAGLEGARSGLWFQIARLLRERRDIGRPVRIVVLENVSALLARGLGVVLGDLAALGYDAEWDCIPASAVGAPHRRDRIWIVAYARGLEHEGFGDAFRRALAEELPRASLAYAHGIEQPEEPEGAGCFERQRPADGRGQQQSAGAGAGGRNLARDYAEGDGWADPAPSNDSHGEGLVSDADSPAFERVSGRLSEAKGTSARRSGDGSGSLRRGWWATEPNVGRVAHGVPARVDRLHGLGNAVVPQIPEAIGRAIIAARMTPANDDQLQEQAA